MPPADDGESKNADKLLKELQKHAQSSTVHDSAKRSVEAAEIEQGPERATEQRRKQLQFLQEFFHNPAILELRDTPIVTSSSRAEIEQRQADLRYRIEMVEALLAVFREELELLSKIEDPGQN